MSALPIQIHETKRRLVLTQGGKGGTGKTTLITALVDWYDAHSYPYTLIDLDTEASKARGSLVHYFPGKAAKVDINHPNGLDRLLNSLQDGPPIVVADMGAGAGAAAYAWFDDVYEGARELGVAFTAIGLITPDPATTDSVLKWAGALQNRTDYLIVKNSVSNPSDFTVWEEGDRAKQFRAKLNGEEIEGERPTLEIIQMEYHHPALEFESRNHGLSVGRVADGKHDVTELHQFTVRIRAQKYRRNIFTEFDRVSGVLLP